MGTRQEYIGVRDIVRAVLERRRLVIATTVVFGLVAVIVSLVMPPTYRAEVLLAPADSDAAVLPNSGLAQYSDLAALVGADMLQRGTDEAVAVLRSRDFSYDFMKRAGVLAALYPDLWDEDEAEVRGSEEEANRLLWEAYGRFDSDIRRVLWSRDEALITLLVDWRDPDVAARWANEMVAQLNLHMQEQAIGECSRSIEFLQRQLDGTPEAEIREAIYRLMEMQMQRMMVAYARDEYAFRVIDAAVAPGQPVRPKRRFIVATGVVLGGFVGLLAAFAVRPESFVDSPSVKSA